MPTASEVDEDTLSRGKVFVDFKESALALAGELRRAKLNGLVSDEVIAGSVGEVITGAVIGRESAADITIFKSLGMACQDLVAADFVLSEAIRQGVGDLVDWE